MTTTHDTDREEPARLPDAMAQDTSGLATFIPSKKARTGKAESDGADTDDSTDDDRTNTCSHKKKILGDVTNTIGTKPTAAAKGQKDVATKAGSKRTATGTAS
ncbi:hypothetical protein BGX29_007176 [Mortierella sp. GBA35]|nr:hypothetical protein BGX29_007176 [Mortierella sp. GBA35]